MLFFFVLSIALLWVLESCWDAIWVIHLVSIYDICWYFAFQQFGRMKSILVICYSVWNSSFIFWANYDIDVGFEWVLRNVRMPSVKTLRNFSIHTTKEKGTLALCIQEWIYSTIAQIGLQKLLGLVIFMNINCCEIRFTQKIHIIES